MSAIIELQCATTPLDIPDDLVWPDNDPIPQHNPGILSSPDLISAPLLSASLSTTNDDIEMEDAVVSTQDTSMETSYRTMADNHVHNVAQHEISWEELFAQDPICPQSPLHSVGNLEVGTDDAPLRLANQSNVLAAPPQPRAGKPTNPKTPHLFIPKSLQRKTTAAATKALNPNSSLAAKLALQWVEHIETFIRMRRGDARGMQASPLDVQKIRQVMRDTMESVDENKGNITRDVVRTYKLARAIKRLAECPVGKSWTEEELGWRAKAAEIGQHWKERFSSP